MNTRTLCLAILSHQDGSGYDIKKLSQNGVYSHYVDASFGSIYPALNKMEKEGLVTSREHVQAGKPSSKIYAITQDGHAALIDELSGPIKNDVYKSQFLMVAQFAPFLERKVVAAALNKHRAYYEGELENIETEMNERGILPQKDGQSDAQRTTNAEELGCEWVGYFGATVVEATLNFINENEQKLLDIAGAALGASMNEAAE